MYFVLVSRETLKILQQSDQSVFGQMPGIFSFSSGTNFTSSSSSNVAQAQQPFIAATNNRLPDKSCISGVDEELRHAQSTDKHEPGSLNLKIFYEAVIFLKVLEPEYNFLMLFVSFSFFYSVTGIVSVNKTGDSTLFSRNCLEKFFQQTI